MFKKSRQKFNTFLFKRFVIWIDITHTGHTLTNIIHTDINIYWHKPLCAHTFYGKILNLIDCLGRYWKLLPPSFPHLHKGEWGVLTMAPYQESEIVYKVIINIISINSSNQYFISHVKSCSEIGINIYIIQGLLTSTLNDNMNKLKFMSVYTVSANRLDNNGK